MELLGASQEAGSLGTSWWQVGPAVVAEVLPGKHSFQRRADRASEASATLRMVVGWLGSIQAGQLLGRWGCVLLWGCRVR